MTEYFNPNLIGRPATPEGHVGVNANIFLPFYSYGRWYASGKQLTYLTAEIRQKRSRPVLGLTRPDTFRKDASSCPIAITAPI